MNITCVICSDLFVPSDDLYFTPCGHTFHYVCLTQWLERSKTCPACRSRVTTRTIHRAYFHFTQTEQNPPNTEDLTHKLDNLKFQILLKEKDIKNCSEDNAKLKNQNAGLREEVKKLEQEITKNQSAIYALKAQVKYFGDLSASSTAAKDEVIRLRKHLADYKSIQSLVSASCEDVEKILDESNDVRTMATYVAVMKREIDNSVFKRRALRDRVHDLERRLREVTTARNALLDEQERSKQLEEQLKFSEAENRSLQSKLRALETKISSGRELRDDSLRYIMESPAPEKHIPSATHSRVSSDSLAGAYSLPIDISTSTDNSIQIIDENEKSMKSPEKSSNDAGSSRLSHKSRKLKPPYADFSIMAKRQRLKTTSKVTDKPIDLCEEGDSPRKSNRDASPVLVGYNPKVIKNSLMTMKIKRRKTDLSKLNFDNVFC